MKKHLLLIAAMAMCSFTFAQHTETDSKTDITNNKAILDGKAFSVILTENITGTTGTPGNVTDNKIAEDKEITKRDVEDGKSPKSGSMSSDLKDNRKMLIHFDNGEVKISGKGEIKNQKCPYNSWGIESTGISFSADCQNNVNANQKNDKTNPGMLLTGTVNGDSVHGSLTCTKEDGSVKTFSYTGSNAGPNDLDMEQEMGLK